MAMYPNWPNLAAGVPMAMAWGHLLKDLGEVTRSTVFST